MFRDVVLGLLCDGEPRHGYALMKAYRERIGVQVTTGNFYRELQHLESGGLVCKVARSGTSDPRQAPYRITATGREAFRRWFDDIGAAETSPSNEDQLSARIMFLTDVSREDGESMLRHWQDELWLRAKTLERARDRALVAAAASQSAFSVPAALLCRRVQHVTADLAFLEEVRAGLRRLRPAVVAADVRALDAVRGPAAPDSVASPSRPRASKRARS